MILERESPALIGECVFGVRAFFLYRSGVPHFPQPCLGRKTTGPGDSLLEFLGYRGYLPFPFLGGLLSGKPPETLGKWLVFATNDG